MSKVFAWSPCAKVEVPAPFTSRRPVVVAFLVTVRSPPMVDEAFVMKPDENVVSPEIAAVDEAESTPCTLRFWLKVDEALERRPDPSVVKPPMLAVLEAERAPLIFTLLVKVLEALEMRPPAALKRPEKAPVEEAESAPVAPIVKSGWLVESTKRRMSPLCPRVVEARIKVPLVEVAKKFTRALLAWSACAVVEVPTKILSAVVVGAK